MSADPGALVRVPTGSVTTRSRELWSDEQVNLIGATVAEGATRAQLMMFLEIAAKYDLDPFAKEIWCAVPRNENGSPKTDKVMIMVGRDGFLKIAQRHPDFLGMDADVVRSEDDFKVTLVNGERSIEHSYGAKRGNIVGAWCMVQRAGRTPTYFYAAMDDFKPNGASARSQWVKGPGTMILKCAEAGALRRAFSISGIVAEEEAQPLDSDRQLEAPAPNAPDALVDRVKHLFEQARVLDQDSYLPAQQRILLAGASEDRLLVIEREVRDFIVAHGGQVTETVDVVEEADDETDVGASASPANETGTSVGASPRESIGQHLAAESAAAAAEVDTPEALTEPEPASAQAEVVDVEADTIDAGYDAEQVALAEEGMAAANEALAAEEAAISGETSGFSTPIEGQPDPWKAAAERHGVAEGDSDVSPGDVTEEDDEPAPDGLFDPDREPE